MAIRYDAQRLNLTFQRQRTGSITAASAMRGKEIPSYITTTTLSALLTVLQDLIGPDNDPLIVATVVHLLRSGRLTLPRTAHGGARWQHNEMWR